MSIELPKEYIPYIRPSIEKMLPSDKEAALNWLAQERANQLWRGEEQNWNELIAELKLLGTAGLIEEIAKECEAYATMADGFSVYLTPRSAIPLCSEEEMHEYHS